MSANRTLSISTAIWAASLSVSLGAAISFTAVVEDPLDVGKPMSAEEGTVSGWDVDLVTVDYDANLDTLTVIFSTHDNTQGGGSSPTIFGDADNDGDPADFTNPMITSPFGPPMPDGMDFASLGSSEFALMAFDLDRDGFTDMTAGIFSSQVHSPNAGVNSFSLTDGLSLVGYTLGNFPALPLSLIGFDGTGGTSSLDDNTVGIPTSYIGPVQEATSPAAPDFSFQILNFSQLANDVALSSGATAFDAGRFDMNWAVGSQADGAYGEDLGAVFPIVIPEPGAVPLLIPAILIPFRRKRNRVTG